MLGRAIYRDGKSQGKASLQGGQLGFFWGWGGVVVDIQRVINEAGPLIL